MTVRSLRGASFAVPSSRTAAMSDNGADPAAMAALAVASAPPSPVSKMCEQCGQAPGQVDRFLLPQQVPLKWARMRANPATGVKEPEGNECFGCEAAVCKHSHFACACLNPS